jgi:TRAP transporter TAXI family solute receptor
MVEIDKVKPNRIIAAGVVLFSLAVIGFVAGLAYQRSKVHTLTLAAGSSSGESYILCSALKTVVERQSRPVRINVIETGGTAENLAMIEDGRAAMAIAQADVTAGPSARIVAVLFDDTFQLLVRRDSKVQDFSELRGMRIALPRTGGQFQSFLRVAEHFGLKESDFRIVGASDAEADQLFADGQADAIFRVRALGNPSIQHLVGTGAFRLVRIGHAAAMKINHPSFEPVLIPAGAYLGNPAVPAEDLPSISVHRTLLARVGADQEGVRVVTAALIENRQEIAAEIPEQARAVRLLLAQVRRPEPRADLGPALHPGALDFYEKDKPPFVLAHADYMGLLLTVLVMVSSWIWELRAWMLRQQKNIADQYSNRVVVLMNAARQASSPEALEEIRGELLEILTAAVGDLDSDKLSEDSFHSFRAILQIGLEDVRDSRSVFQKAEYQR